MGRFLQNTIAIEQAGNGLYKTLTDLAFISDKGFTSVVKAGYITDGYSKPQITKFLVDGSFEDDIRCSTIHDSACQFKGYYDENLKFHPLTFKQANDLFLECMKAAKLPLWKQISFRIAVAFNPGRW